MTTMRKIISLPGVDESIQFVKKIDSFNSHFYLTNCNYRVNAKSLLSVLSVIQTPVVTLEIVGEDNETLRILSAIDEYVLS